MLAGQHVRGLLLPLAEAGGTDVFREPEGYDPLSDVAEIHAVVSGSAPASTSGARRSHRHL